MYINKSMTKKMKDLIEIIDAYLKAEKNSIEILKTIQRLLHKVKLNSGMCHNIMPFILRTRDFTNDSFVKFICNEILEEYQKDCISKNIRMFVIEY